MTYAPETRLGQTAWSVSRSPGVWRHDWIDDRAPDGKFIKRRVRQGLIMTEALRRCGSAPAADRSVLLEFLSEIEAGEVTGQALGWDIELDLEALRAEDAKE